MGDPKPRHADRPWFQRRTDPNWCLERLHWWTNPEDAAKCCHPEWRRVTITCRGPQAIHVPGRWERREAVEDS